MKQLFFFLALTFGSFAQNIDVQKYHLDITVSDDSDIIKVQEKIQILFTKNSRYVILDLVNQNDEGKGMSITSVKENDYEMNYQHKNDQLIIETNRGFESNVFMYTIEYSGIPKDGLVIGENKYGARTIFGDNWPNRAHNWFACVDHPSDKAAIHYTVTAPKHYQCVANGKMIQSQEINKTQTKFIFDSDIQLPTKVMVIGLAELKFEQMDFPELTVTNAVYPEDKDAGFHDMKAAYFPLEFFIENIGPYPYEELYNVQSTTRFGGMENAGCIFYDENAITGKGTMDDLLAHEIAHQWFGNSVTETDWQHLWLSEGFATYFTNLNIENRYGREKMNAQLIKDRNRVIGFSKNVALPVIDTLSSDLMQLLNPNAYQKGSWFLHMLRYKIGDEAFWNGIRTYYDDYKYRNASTNDFMKAMQTSSGQPLQSFFDQWLRTSGHPILKTIISKKNRFSIEQIQEGDAFEFPIEVKLTYDSGETQLLNYYLTTKLFTYKSNDKRTIKSIELDPNVNLLFEEGK